MTEQNYEDNKIETEFNGYSLFTEVEDKTLQAFNRCVVMFNIMEHSGEAMAQDYAENLDEKDRSIMYAMFAFIRDRGLEETKYQITNNNLSYKSKEETILEEAKNATIN